MPSNRDKIQELAREIYHNSKDIFTASERMMNDDQQIIFDYIKTRGFYAGLHLILTAQASKEVDVAYINLTKQELVDVLSYIVEDEEE